MELSPKTQQELREVLDTGKQPAVAALHEVANALYKTEPEQPTEGKKKKQPKETDDIKAILKAYTTLQKRIDNTEKRLECLELSMDVPPPSNLSGMPSGTRDGSSKQERDYIKWEELKEKLDNMYAEENRRREDIEGLIEFMKKPNEQTVIEMHYLDGAVWKAISVALHGDEDDYDENEKRYLKRTFKIHGSALQSLARILKEHDEIDYLLP